MSPLSSWLRIGGQGAHHGKAAGEAAKHEEEEEDRRQAQEREKLVDALRWTALIMNDDIDGAWRGLQAGDSSFHDLGAAVTFFMRSVLGFEKEVMAETSAKLAACETRAWADYKKAQGRVHKKGGGKEAKGEGRGSSIYPPGTEYELVRAQTQLMGAVVGVLHESLVEAMRSFYKLRKAFIILDGIAEGERRAVAAMASRNGSKVSVADAAAGQAKDSQAWPDRRGTRGGDGESSESNDFVDAPEQQSTAMTTPESDEARSSSPCLSSAASMNLEGGDLSRATPLKLESWQDYGHDDDAMHGLDDPVDIFINSGTNMCLGLVLLILSLVPPSLSRILSVVGFRGDRARGVRMLWRSAAHMDNVNGALAGMVLLAYYNGLLGAVDVVPAPDDYDESAEAVGPPPASDGRCTKLLADLGARYPDSQLWRIEEARMLASDRQLGRAVKVLQTAGRESRMKQVAALSEFELALDAMMLQDWKLMGDSFLRCLKINDWSPAMYYYMAACAALELYRDALHGRPDLPDEAARHKARAEKYFLKAPLKAGKKRLMARQLPIEAFVQLKVARWEARAKELGVSLADAVGASPALEMSYMWNGQKRMAAQELQRGVDNLAWARCTASPDVVQRIRQDQDEAAVRAVCLAALLRAQGKLDEARAELQDHVLSHERAIFKGTHKDDWVYPAAVYEMGVIAWVECCNPPAGEPEAKVAAYRRERLDECEAQLEKVRVWEAFVLDVRIGMRVQSGLETVAWLRRKMAW
ncbi:hypothetical protein CDD81_2070 [Ophiocordyceps australis]|uniref:Inclusion body clearance protein IML2 n=1 Tax=Ophiocordyceps australis TaxID=1399860 RepID=A0A2C5XYV8_9HYPO|nr:hypothetical protein CDD81_2070 [Ophiocordyceps australis]